MWLDGTFDHQINGGMFWANVGLAGSLVYFLASLFSFAQRKGGEVARLCSRQHLRCALLFSGSQTVMTLVCWGAVVLLGSVLATPTASVSMLLAFLFCYIRGGGQAGRTCQTSEGKPRSSLPLRRTLSCSLWHFDRSLIHFWLWIQTYLFNLDVCILSFNWKLIPCGIYPSIKKMKITIMYVF